VALKRQGLTVHPRGEWASVGPILGLVDEQEIRVLIIHHSDTPNKYDEADVPKVLASMRHFHTNDKGWRDVAYNFFVDRFGGVWEGRLGSLDRRVAGDATGGNQGSSQLICLVGTFYKELPTAAAMESLEKLLAALADSVKLDTSRGATGTFVSRGSNRWARGTTVSVHTIEGHRSLSQTDCPGDPIFTRIASGQIAEAVTARRKAVS
jgi:N-acetylmuramoyl-L-alanine amidase